MLPKIGISIGHSSKDSGACSFHEGVRYKEYDLNKKLFNEIIKLPLKHATWWQSDQLCDDLKYPDHLVRTIHQVNAHSCICAVEIHHNSVWDTTVRGGMAIYWDTSVKGKPLSDMIAWQLQFMPYGVGYDGVEKHWVNVQKKLYHVGSLGTIRHIQRRLAFLGDTKVPACIIEPAFISNFKDLMFCMNYRKEIARAIRNGIDAWCKAQV